MNISKRVFGNLLILFTSIMSIIGCFGFESIAADENESLDSAKNGIVQVNSVYVDDNGASHIVLGCTGFLIGNEDDGEYVITTNSVASPSKETKEKALKSFGLTNENGEFDNINLQVSVVIARDVAIDALVVTRSTDLNISVLKLAQPIHDREPMTIYANDSDEKIYGVTDSVYALGFPKAVRYDENAVTYDKSDVSVTSGTISNIKTKDDIEIISHTATVAGNNCGGPLINEDGYVIGVLNKNKDGEYFTAVESSELVRILDALGLNYLKVTDSSIEAKEQASSAAIFASIEQLEKEREEEIAYRDKKYNMMLLSLALLGLVFVIAIIIIVIMAIKMKNSNSNKKRDNKKAKEKDISNGITKEYASDGRVIISSDIFVSSKNPELVRDEKSGQTSLLGGYGNGETTVFKSNASGNNASYGKLIRCKNSDTKLINKKHFIIGKDSLHVDFCIKDNSSISRQHAVIEILSGGIYICDFGSTNGTYVNGEKLMQGQKYKLRDKDKIRLANEEFEYLNN